MPLTTQEIEALKKITSPSVANAIETFKVRPREQGNVSSAIRALFPEMGPMVGYAVPCVIRAEAGPIEGHRASTYGWWDFVQSIPAGAKAPKLVPDLSIASSMTQSAADAGMFIASPGDNSTYFYMEGMNAPMGSYAGYGHAVRAVAIADRSLKEEKPGLYAANVRIPEAGRYDVAVILESPRVVHCFSVQAEANPAMREALGQVKVEVLGAPLKVAPGATTVRFKVVDPATGEAKRGLSDVSVLHFLAPGRDRTVVAAREAKDGEYEATLSLAKPGAYYLHVGIPSLGVKPGDLPYHTLVVAEGPRRPAETGPRASVDR